MGLSAVSKSTNDGSQNNRYSTENLSRRTDRLVSLSQSLCSVFNV
jgi:hypothetical protein